MFHFELLLSVPGCAPLEDVALAVETLLYVDPATGILNCHGAM